MSPYYEDEGHQVPSATKIPPVLLLREIPEDEEELDPEQEEGVCSIESITDDAVVCRYVSSIGAASSGIGTPIRQSASRENSTKARYYSYTFGERLTAELDPLIASIRTLRDSTGVYGCAVIRNIPRLEGSATTQSLKGDRRPSGRTGIEIPTVLVATGESAKSILELMENPPPPTEAMKRLLSDDVD